MIRWTVAFFLGGISLSPVALADEPLNGEVVNVNAHTVYAPVGFDDNDDVEILVDGYLPSGCYRLTSPEINVDHAAKRISIRPMARYFDVPCIEMLVPFTFEAEVGQLEESAYTVEVEGPDVKLTEALPVKHAFGPGPDEHAYVPVDDVKVELDQVNHRLVAHVRGRLTNSCMRWEEAKVEDNGKTINLLPLLAVDTRDNCEPTETPYEQTVVLPDTIARGRHVLHVRSLNGQAVNAFFFKN